VLRLLKVLKPQQMLLRRVRPGLLVQLVLLVLREPYLRKLLTLQALQAPAGLGEVIQHNSKGP